jgi:hypothetical protein
MLMTAIGLRAGTGFATRHASRLAVLADAGFNFDICRSCLSILSWQIFANCFSNVLYGRVADADFLSDRSLRHPRIVFDCLLGQIATQFRVSQQTISSDQSNLPETGKSKPNKTATNPKGAGRHRGKRTGPQPERRTDAPEATACVLDEGLTAGASVVVPHDGQRNVAVSLRGARRRTAVLQRIARPPATLVFGCAN